MTHPRAALLSLAIVAPLGFLTVVAPLPALAQSVVSTHSGVLYFFEGSVFLGDQQLEQKFGRFPDIPEGGLLRTDRGRAEVLLTPGVFLRLGEHSSIRMVSNKLSDTRVELLTGSAIVEANQPSRNGPSNDGSNDGSSATAAAGTSVALIHKNWRVQIPHEGVYRIDAEPAQLQVYKGQAEVLADASDQPVTVKQGESMPLAAVLVPERPPFENTDPFKTWAMTRSQAIASDNAIAEGITDDPTQVDNSGLPQGGFSYYPYVGTPYVGLGNPYGLSFWSPYQPGMTSLYLPMYMYRMYPGWPSTARYQSMRGGTLGVGSLGGLAVHPLGTPITPMRIGVGGVRPSSVYTPPSSVYTPPGAISVPRPITPITPRVGTPRVGGVGRVGGGHR